MLKYFAQLLLCLYMIDDTFLNILSCDQILFIEHIVIYCLIHDKQGCFFFFFVLIIFYEGNKIPYLMEPVF